MTMFFMLFSFGLSISIRYKKDAYVGLRIPVYLESIMRLRLAGWYCLGYHRGLNFFKGGWDYLDDSWTRWTKHTD